jgi:hypothetical protein
MGLIAGAIAFLVWDNVMLTKRAERQANARTKPFPPTRNGGPPGVGDMGDFDGD